jgi:hypothetical protein
MFRSETLGQPRGQRSGGRSRLVNSFLATSGAVFGPRIATTRRGTRAVQVWGLGLWQATLAWVVPRLLKFSFLNAHLYVFSIVSWSSVAMGK